MWKCLLFSLAVIFFSTVRAQNTLDVTVDGKINNIQMAKWIAKDSVVLPVMHVSPDSIKNKWILASAKLKDGRPVIAQPSSSIHFFNIYSLYQDTLNRSLAAVATIDTLYKDTSRIRQLPHIITSTMDTIKSVKSFYYPYFDKTGRTAYLDTAGRSIYRRYDNNSNDVSQAVGADTINMLFPANISGISVIHLKTKGYTFFDIVNNKLVDPTKIYQDSLYPFSQDVFIAVDKRVRSIVKIVSPEALSTEPILGYEILKTPTPVLKIQLPDSSYTLLIDKATSLSLPGYKESQKDNLFAFPFEDSLLLRLFRPDTAETPASPDSTFFYYIVKLSGTPAIESAPIYKSSVDGGHTSPLYRNCFINLLESDVFYTNGRSHRKFGGALRALYKIQRPDVSKESDFFLLTGTDTATQIQILRVFTATSAAPKIEAVSHRKLVTSGLNWHTFQENMLIVKDKSKGWRCYDGYIAATNGKNTGQAAEDGLFENDSTFHIYYVTTLPPSSPGYPYQYRAMLTGEIGRGNKIVYRQYYLYYKGKAPKPKEKDPNSVHTGKPIQKKSIGQQHVK